MFSKKIKKTIKVDGMHCEHCANKVINALENIEGIEKFVINPKELIKFNNIDIDENLLQKVLHGSGFEVEADEGFIFLNFSNEIAAYGEVTDNYVRIKRVFFEYR